MPMPRRIIAVAALLLAACADDGGPAPLGGTYTLADIDGIDLPYLRVATPECDATIEGGGLELEETAFTLHIIDGNDCLRDGSPPTLTTRTYQGTWSDSAGRLHLTLGGAYGGGFSTSVDDPRVILLRDPLPYPATDGVLRFERVLPLIW
jgi:hypothetical protein